ncbi:hypothetical protein LCL95_08705 [Bacillus timonensis]|nr:hypothetical protein [Bacillus timonensis]
MVSITRKYKHVKMKMIYFPTEAKFNEYHDCDLLAIIQSPVLVTGLEEFETFHIQLTKSIEELYRNVGKTTRNLINRGINKDLFLIGVITNPSDIDIVQFQSFYNEFAKNKNTALCSSFHVQTLKLLRDEGSLIMTTVSNREGAILCYHVYVVDEDRAMLLYSGSHFRMSKDKQSRDFIGRANRTLHWKDILWFKEKDYRIYDIGGTTKEPSIKSFKAEFGGATVVEYSGYKACTLLGSMALMYRKWRDRTV